MGIILIFYSVVHATEDPTRFHDWYGIDDNDQKKIVGFSGTDSVTLTVYIDDQMITRLKFDPKRKVERAEFDDRTYRGMNYESLYGYDHWIRKMIRHYNLKIWFEGEPKYEIFSLHGFSKAVNWLTK